MLNQESLHAVHRRHQEYYRYIPSHLAAMQSLEAPANDAGLEKLLLKFLLNYDDHSQSRSQQRNYLIQNVLTLFLLQPTLIQLKFHKRITKSY